MICGRCQEPILDDEEYTTFVPDSGSTAAADLPLHKELCQRAPQTSLLR